MDPIQKSQQLSEIKIYMDSPTEKQVASAPSGALTVSEQLPEPRVTLVADNIKPQSGLEESAYYYITANPEVKPGNVAIPRPRFQFTGYEVVNNQVNAHFKLASMVEEPS